MARVVVFNEHGARILEGQNPDDYRGIATALIEPEIPVGVPPHFWKIEDGKIAIMTKAEVAKRMGAIEELEKTEVKPVQNHQFVETIQVARQVAREEAWKWCATASGALILGAIVSRIIQHYL